MQVEFSSCHKEYYIYHILVFLRFSHKSCRLYEIAFDGTGWSSLELIFTLYRGILNNTIWARLSLLAGLSPHCSLKQQWKVFNNDTTICSRAGSSLWAFSYIFIQPWLTCKENWKKVKYMGVEGKNILKNSHVLHSVSCTQNASLSPPLLQVFGTFFWVSLLWNLHWIFTLIWEMLVL